MTLRPAIYRRRALRGWWFLLSAVLVPLVAIAVREWLLYSRGGP